MKSTAIVCAIAAASLGFSTLSLAQDYDRRAGVKTGSINAAIAASTMATRVETTAMAITTTRVARSSGTAVTSRSNFATASMS